LIERQGFKTLISVAEGLTRSIWRAQIRLGTTVSGCA